MCMYWKLCSVRASVTVAVLLDAGWSGGMATQRADREGLMPRLPHMTSVLYGTWLMCVLSQRALIIHDIYVITRVIYGSLPCVIYDEHNLFIKTFALVFN